MVWMDRFLTPRRARDYPRLMLLAVAVVLAAHVQMRSGWLGGLGQIIGSDFVTLYAAGTTWRSDPSSLYDLQDQAVRQQALIAPTPLPGLNPYISPPYVAMAYSLLTHLPVVVALVLWQSATVGAVVAAATVLSAYEAGCETVLRRRRLWQLVVVALSCFAFVEGFVVGQNHGITLLLASLAVVLSLRHRDVVAGACAGLLIYKPQFAVGLLLVWLLWGRHRSLAGFCITAGLWVGAMVLADGLELTAAYAALGDDLLQLPYTPGFPSYLLVTPYGLLATVLGDALRARVWRFSQVWSVLVTIGLAALAWRSRRSPERCRGALAAALLYPLLASPYSLLHDLVLLVPVFVLLTGSREANHKLLRAAAIGYVAMLVLTLVGQATGLALVALIPVSVAASQAKRLWPRASVSEPLDGPATTTRQRNCEASG